MQYIPIAAIPNQLLQVSIDQNQYSLAIYAIAADYDEFNNPFNVIMAVDITINNIVILTGLRVVAGYPIIPYEYLENGNFAFQTQNDDYPDYSQFNITQNLIYASATELAEIRAAGG